MSGKSKTQHRKSGRSARSNQQRTSSGSYGKGAGGGPAPSPSANTSSSLPSSNRSFKKSHNAQGGHLRTNKPTVNSWDSTNNASSHSTVQNAAHSEPLIHGASDAPVVGRVAKQVELFAPQRSTQAPSPRSCSMRSDSTAPAKAPEDPSKAFHFQFGSIGIQIPVQTTTALLNLDEQKHDQVRQDTYKSVPNIPTPSVPKQQLPRKDGGAPDQSSTGEAHQVPKVKKDPQVSLPPTTSQTQKPSVLPIPMTSKQMPHDQNVTATSLPLSMPIPLQMGNAPQVKQHVFIPDLQPHPIQPQGLMDQGKGMGFTTQMDPPQLPLQLGNMGMDKTTKYPQQQGEKFGGCPGKTVVKIIHPDTQKEVRLDERADTYPDGGFSGPRSQSQPIPSFAHAYPINYYPNSDGASSIYYPAPDSVPLTGSQLTPNIQTIRFNYTVGEGPQDVSFMNPNLNSLPVSKAATSIPGVVEPPNLNRSKRSTARGKKKRKEILQKADAAGTTSSSKDKTVVGLNRSKSSTARGKKKRKEILQKADAARTTSDHYMAYKGPEKKKETVPSESAESTPSVGNSKQEPVGIVHVDDVPIEKSCLSKADPDDREDAADHFTPKLEPSDGREQALGVHRDEDGNGKASKMYSRDFLQKFSEQCTDFSEVFEMATDIAEALNSGNIDVSLLVDRGLFPSHGRVMDRQSGGPQADHRGSVMVDDDRCGGPPGTSLGRDLRPDVGYGPFAGFCPGQGSNYGILMNPRAQILMQYPGGIRPGPMQPKSPQVAVQRNSLNADRWQRIANFQQKGILPSPQTPLQMMHKADRKYEVGKVQDEEEAKQRRLKVILDKLTPQNFKKLFEQLKAVNFDNVVMLAGFTSQIFDKALMEPTFCEMYANFCSYLASELPAFSEDNEKITFKRLLLNKCQEEFERGEREQEEANQDDNEGRIKQTEEERKEKRIKARRRMLGNIRLIGELYKKKMLTERIMHECIKKLLGQYENHDEEDVEALCELMNTIGKMIDHPKAKEHMDTYFDRMAKLSNNMKLSSRVRFMLKDAIELRENKWQQRRKVEGPKKIEEEHRDAAQELQAQVSTLAGDPSMNSPTRRVPMDFGPRGLFSPTNQMGRFRGIPTQNRGGYDAQDIRFEDRQSYEAWTLSVPLAQRQTGDDSITLGPQGCVARGMSIRGPTMMSSNTLLDISPDAGEPRRMTAGLNGFNTSELPAYGSREDVILRYHLDRFGAPPAFDQLSAQEHNTNDDNRDIRTPEQGFDRHLATSPPIRGQAPAVTPDIPSEKAWPEKCLQDMSMAAIKEFSSVFVMSNRKDPVWKYGREVDREENKGYKYFQCNFCLKILKGGVFGMKEHLTGVHGNVAPCMLVPPEVRDEIKNYMEKHYEAQKVAQMYIEERIDQGVSLHNKSSSSLATSVPRRSVREPIDRFPLSVKKGEEGNPVVITRSEELCDRTTQDIGRFFFENGIAFNVANSPSFISMLRSVGNFGRGLKPPTSFELSTTILNKEVATTKEVVDSLKKSWKQTGVSIMSDGWKDMRGRQLINFLVNSPSGTVFLKSVDASDVVKDANLLFKLLDEIVEEVGEDIVVQVVTDNASNYKKAGELLMQKRTRLWWTPCATHCIDLMLEDIGKLPQHENALIKAKKVSTFIYNRGAVLALMRIFTKKELPRPAPTRFATAYLTLQSMYSLKQNLEQMFTSKEWNELSLSKKPEGREVKKIILNDRFWINMAYALKTTKPLVNVLRMMDSEKMSGMGFIYGAINKAKEEIAKNLEDEVGAHKEIWKIIDDRWEFQMHHHLHAAAYFLNPQIQYSDNPSKHPKIKLGFFMCMDKLMSNDDDKMKADMQVDAFLKRTGMFSFGQAKHLIFNRSPADWWSQYGDQTPELQSLAIKILSLTCSSFGCERNWSAFNFIHIKRRNRLSTQKLNSLLYVMYNKKLQYKFLKKQSLKEDEDPLVEDEIPSDDEWVVAEDNIEETSSEGFVGVDISHLSGSRSPVEKRYQGKGKSPQLVYEEPEWEDNASDEEDDRGIRYDNHSLEDDTSDNDGGDDTLEPLFRPLDTYDNIFRD